MDNKDIVVSVIIPTYKRPVAFLSRAVESVLNQSHKNVEVVVIDDSPDEFEERRAIKEYMSSIQDDRVIYLMNEKNLGGSLSRNRGIDTAKGAFITFLDDDDEYMPEKVEKQLDFMLNRDCEMSFSDMIMYSEEGKVVDYREYTDIPSYDNESLLKYHLMKHLTGTPTFMFKTEVLRDIGGFDDAKMGQEFYLMLKSINNGLKIRYMSGCYVKVYKHSGEGISSGRNKITGEKKLYEFKKQFFDRLSASEKRYIRFRHYAVLVVAYKRNKKPMMMLLSGLRSFASAPLVFFKEIWKFCAKIFSRNKDR